MMTPKELLPHYKIVNKLMFAKDYGSVNTLLEELPIHETDTMLLVGLIRLTFSIREDLSSWTNSRDLIYIELSVRGLDADTILNGLWC